jgi:hypothetical protein
VKNRGGDEVDGGCGALDSLAVQGSNSFASTLELDGQG